MFVRTMRCVLRTPALLVLLSLSALGLAGCSSSDSPTTTSPTTTPALATETFNGSIGQNEAHDDTFTVTSSGYSLLAGFTSISPASVTALGLGIGNWDPATSTCSLNVSQNDTARSGSTGLSGTANSGSYCLRVYDGGNVAGGVVASYTVQVQHY